MARLALAAGILLTALPASAAAQRADSTRAGVAPGATRQPAAVNPGYPSPRRAFLTSLIAPGSMQLRFKRPKAAAIFLLAEAGAVGMSLKSWNDLSKAKKARADTVGTPQLDENDQPVLDPETGEPVITYAPKNKNLADRVRARRSHLEDWIAVVVFNHLFAGADAYVSANLADFDANVQVANGERRMGVSARIAW
jgi:hypothetical protein